MIQLLIRILGTFELTSSTTTTTSTTSCDTTITTNTTTASKDDEPKTIASVSVAAPGIDNVQLSIRKQQRHQCHASAIETKTATTTTTTAAAAAVNSKSSLISFVSSTPKLLFEEKTWNKRRNLNFGRSGGGFQQRQR